MKRFFFKSKYNLSSLVSCFSKPNLEHYMKVVSKQTNICFYVFFFFFFFFVNHFLSQSKGDKQHHVYEQHTKERYVSERMSGPAINYDHNLLKVIFYHLRDQLRTTINSNTQLDKHSSDYIITRVCLDCVQIQIESVECRGFNVSFDLCIW